MKSYAFYVAPISLGYTEQGVSLPDGRVVYLRIVEYEGTDLEALHQAEAPRPGEQLMNTHTL